MRLPAQKPLLEALAGKPVEMTVQPYAMWEGRGCRNGYTWLTPGLSHIDLYWKLYDGTEGGTDQAEWPRLKIEDLCCWSIRAEGAVEHVYPGAGRDPGRQGQTGRGPDPLGHGQQETRAP